MEYIITNNNNKNTKMCIYYLTSWWNELMQIVMKSRTTQNPIWEIVFWKWIKNGLVKNKEKKFLPHEIPHDIMRNSSWKLLFDLRWTSIVSGLRCSFHLRTLHFRWSVCVLHSSLIESMNECSKYLPASKMIAYFLSQELHYKYLYSPSGDADTI